MKTIWNNRYVKTQWLGSGPGSRGIAQYYKTHVLNEMLSKYAIASIVDIGCGDMCWVQTELFRENSLSGIDFLGIDISDVIVEQNIKSFPDFKFIKSDISKTQVATPADLVLCFDVLIHQPTLDHFESALKNILAATKSYCLVSYHNPEKPSKPVFPEGFDQVKNRKKSFNKS